MRMRMSVAFAGSGAFFGCERRAAAAGRCRVRIFDGEAATSDGLDEIHLGAFKVPDADGVDEQLDAIRLEDLIGVAAVLFDHQTVLKPRASSALYKHAEPAILLLLFGE